MRLGKAIFIVEIYWRSTPSMQNTAASLPQDYLNVRGHAVENVSGKKSSGSGLAAVA